MTITNDVVPARYLGSWDDVTAKLNFSTTKILEAATLFSTNLASGYPFYMCQSVFNDFQPFKRLEGSGDGYMGVILVKLGAKKSIHTISYNLLIVAFA